MGKVLFVACTNVGKAMISAIMQSSEVNSEIVGIVNLNSSRALNKANYFTYLDISEKYNIPLHFCDNVNDAVTLNWIKEKNPDIIIQTGWSQKFKSELLNIPKYGCIGEHPAPLPRGRGAACVNWAILTGESEWGDTFFKMVDEYDRGEVYAQKFFDIKEYDDVKSVYDKVAECSRNIVIENIDNWSRGVFSTISLDESKATYFKRRTPADGLFDFTLPANELHNFIRAQTEPYPGAFFMKNGEKITVLSSQNTKSIYKNNKAGDVVGISDDGGILVVCGDKIAIKLIKYRNENGIIKWFSEDDRFTTTNNLGREIE